RQRGRGPMGEHHPWAAAAVDAAVEGRSVAFNLHDCLREACANPHSNQHARRKDAMSSRATPPTMMPQAPMFIGQWCKSNASCFLNRSTLRRQYLSPLFSCAVLLHPAADASGKEACNVLGTQTLAMALRFSAIRFRLPGPPPRFASNL